jgi:hypothetical protein
VEEHEELGNVEPDTKIDFKIPETSEFDKTV